MSQVEEIKSKIDIVDLIRDYLKIKAVGVNFQALCPFHNEKSPSFVISPEKQIWHCFGCGKGGDIFSFVMEKESLNFPEALRLLANKAGVVLQHENNEIREEKNRVLDILDLSVKYYQYLLKSDQAQGLRDYLQERALSPEQIESWAIGYSQNSWDSLYKFLKARPLQGEKYSDEEILAAGLIIKKERGSGYYDRFRDRIMFPIWDANGNVVAFTARINPLKAQTEKTGKYINSPQTKVFDKSRVLFALNRAKSEIRAKDLAVVVEGQMDAIACHNNNIKNVVASSGTALTTEQVALIKRYTNKVALVFDMDSAGQMAVDRGVRECLAQGMEVKIITLPSGKDPDESLKNNPGELERGVEMAGLTNRNFESYYKKPIEDAKSILEYYFERSSAGLDLTKIENKTKVRDKMFEILVMVKDRSEQGYWLKKISDDLDFPEIDFREEFFRRYPRGEEVKNNIINQGGGSSLVKPESKNREERLSESFLSIVIKNPDLFSYASNNLSPEILFPENLSIFYKQLIIYYNKNKKIDYHNLADYFVDNKEEADLLRYLSILSEKDFYNLEKEELKTQLINIISDLKSFFSRRRMEELRKKITLAEKENNEELLTSLMEELKKIMDLK